MSNFGVEHDGDQRVQRASTQRGGSAKERGTQEREGRRHLLAGLDTLRAQWAYHLALGVIIGIADGLLAGNAGLGGTFGRGCRLDGFGVLKL
jgi:hypothetical protein